MRGKGGKGRGGKRESNPRSATLSGPDALTTGPGKADLSATGGNLSIPHAVSQAARALLRNLWAPGQERGQLLLFPRPREGGGRGREGEARVGRGREGMRLERTECFASDGNGMLVGEREVGGGGRERSILSFELPDETLVFFVVFFLKIGGMEAGKSGRGGKGREVGC